MSGDALLDEFGRPALTERGIRLLHRIHDCDPMGLYQGRPSPIAAGKWEVHHNPHDDDHQVRIRLLDGELTQIPGRTRSRRHPFDDRTWQHLRATVMHHTDADIHEANLAEALDRLMRRARTGRATRTEQHLLTCGRPTRIPPRARSVHERREQDPGNTVPGTGEDSLDELDDGLDESPLPSPDADEDDPDSPAPPYTGYGLYDAHEEP
ncbi:hypothetical protein ACIRL2_50065 [Embleya sp. NPDC127516]|uniref:hypothetical protein n=1 Tax=Embleya sp. NPDC127516 TaxID=3363990 RepID=UPI003803E1A7